MTFQDKSFDLSFTITLTANQTTGPIGVALDKDADFIWEGVQIQYEGNGGNPGLPFGIQFTDASRYILSDDYISGCEFASATGLGVPVWFSERPFFFPAGSSIIVDLQEQSGNSNGPLQIIFKGRKRFYG